MYERKGTELTPKIDLSTNTSNNNRYSSTSSSMNSASTNTNSSAQQSNNNSNPSNYSSVPADPENQNGNSGVKNQGQPVSDTNTGPGFKQGPGIQIGSEVIWSPGKHGTYMSFLLLLSGMIASIVAMSYAPSITKENFTNDCPSGYESSCQRTGVVLRFSFALVIIFTLNLLGTLCFTSFYDRLWLIKFAACGGTVVGFFYLSQNVFDANGYAWAARIGGFLFLIFQQVILLDFALVWNEKWVGYAAESTDSCNMYIVGLLASSSVLIMGSISAIGVMYWQFGAPGCSENLAVISLTLVLSVLVTIFQLFMNEEYSLLASAMMMAYATYICYATVTLNPSSTCNPTLATGYQVLQEAIGMAITVLSLIWSTQTAVQRLQELQTEGEASSDPDAPQDYTKPGLQALFIESTIVFILISCYYGMVLTNWATLQSSDSINNPKTGTASFWLQASAQWICLLLYVWALLAPKLFPDRDFGRQH